MKRMKKVVAAMLALMMLFSVSSVCASAATAQKYNISATLLSDPQSTYELSLRTQWYSFTKETDISYGSDENQVYDLYLPETVETMDNVPVFLMIHGGAFTGGSRSEQESFCMILAAAGFIVINVDYRLTDSYNGVSLLDMNDDMYAAVKNAKKHLAKEGIKTNQMATFGYSAGAYLALMYGYSHQKDSPLEIKFMSAGCAPTDFTEEGWLPSFFGTTKEDLVEYITGDDYTDEMIASGKADKMMKKMSISNYVTKDSPAALLLYGSNDFIVPARQKTTYLETLDKTGAAYELQTCRYGGHLSLVTPEGLTWVERTLDWADDYFSAPTEK